MRSVCPMAKHPRVFFFQACSKNSAAAEGSLKWRQPQQMLHAAHTKFTRCHALTCSDLLEGNNRKPRQSSRDTSIFQLAERTTCETCSGAAFFLLRITFDRRLERFGNSHGATARALPHARSSKAFIGRSTPMQCAAGGWVGWRSRASGKLGHP